QGASNQAIGVDGSFSFFQDLNTGGYYARSRTEGLNHDNDSYQGRFDYSPDRYGIRLDYLKVGDNFNPEVGFTRRDNFRRSFGALRFRPRPRGSKLVRKYTSDANIEYLIDGSDQLESRQRGVRFNTEFQNSDAFSVEVNNNY